MAQDALNRWWWPSLMMFGPPDTQSQHSDASMRWKIKRFTNDSLRQKFVDATVPQGHYLGLTFPDPELRFDEATGHWEFGAIDWDEFRRVLAGDGPCNRERLAARRHAHEDGAWVREAALAYAAKQQAARAARGGLTMTEPATPLWEVFIRARTGLAHRHVGSVHAADATNGVAGGARRLYTPRRGTFHLGRAVGGDHRLRSVGQGHAVRADRFEDLPPPDLLRSA